ncbi:FbpB family small basic protein [Calidifontibacillus oryziterrae]|nr:FbpB family small basic protein [Calidifontibacillus oryziterrae]
MKKKRPSFHDLVMKNKQELMENKDELDRIEMKLERKHAKLLVGNK